MNDTRAPSTVKWIAPTADAPVNAVMAIPGSKSIMARALTLAAASNGTNTITAPLVARDTALMAAGIRALGCDVDTSDDSRWVIEGRPLTGPATIDCGLAGTVMRFLPPLAATASGTVTFDGDPRARQRPMAPLLDALTGLGIAVVTDHGKNLPFTLTGTGHVDGGEITIDASTSSQLVSGLLLSGARYEKGLIVRHEGAPVPSMPHIRMTIDMLRAAGVTVDDSSKNVWEVAPGNVNARNWDIEPDLSNAAPFLAAAVATSGSVTVTGWPQHTSQPGDALRGIFNDMGASVSLTDDGLTVTGTGRINGIAKDLSAIGELTPVIAALCALADGPSRLSGIAHLRGHETDRLAALRHELCALGADVTEHDDGLSIKPRPLTGTVFETYDDHRMAHAAAVIGVAIPNVALSDVGCTSKTLPKFPSMWNQLLGKN